MRILNFNEQRYTLLVTDNNRSGQCMIQGFKCKDTQALFETGKSRIWANVLRGAERKLSALNIATELKDLGFPPGNRLEALTGKRKGQHSIRINDQWRICFIWAAAGPTAVEIVDYH